MPSFGKTSPLKKEHFTDFEKAYTAKDRHKIKDERWSAYTREQIENQNKGLDLGLIRDNSVLDYNDLPNPLESAENIIIKLAEATNIMKNVVKELKTITKVK